MVFSRFYKALSNDIRQSTTRSGLQFSSHLMHIINFLIMHLNFRASFNLFCKCINVLLVQTLTNCNCKPIHMDVAPAAV